MRLSTIFELLLIFLLIAFAAYARVIEPANGRLKKVGSTSASSAAMSLKQAAENVNKYCVCNENICNCCRDFHIPLVQLSGPGCASLQYLQDNKLAMQLSIGDNILSSNIVNGNNPKPVCVNLPGGFSKFCGKIYSIKKEADKNFKACLSLELRSGPELEASLRVSCFRFGPDGLKLRPAEPLPPSFSEAPAAASSDDDYDDIFGLDDEDEDDEDDEQADNDDLEKVSAAATSSSSASSSLDPEQQNEEEQGADEEDDDDDDLLGLSALFDIFTGDDDSGSNKRPRPAASSTPLPTSFTIPILALTSTATPAADTYSAESTTSSNKVSSAPTLASNHDDQRTSTEETVETTTTTTTTSLNDQTTKIAYVVDAQHSHGTGINDVSGAKQVMNDLNKSKMNATQVKQSDKKKLAATANKLTKINKQAIKQQTVGDATEPLLDITAESIYDDDSDEDVAISDENDDDGGDDDDDDDDVDDGVNKIKGTNESDQAASSEDTQVSPDDDYDQSDEDSDENEDVEVMSTLLDDEISTEQTKQRNNKRTANRTDATTTTMTSSDYDYELSEILARKYSNPRVRDQAAKGQLRKLHPSDRSK